MCLRLTIISDLPSCVLKTYVFSLLLLGKKASKSLATAKCRCGQVSLRPSAAAAKCRCGQVPLRPSAAAVGEKIFGPPLENFRPPLGEAKVGPRPLLERKSV